MLVGCGWIFVLIVLPLLQYLTNRKELADYLFTTIFHLIMASPGGFAAYFGFRLIKEKNKQNIKASVGTLAVFGAILLTVLANHIGWPTGIEHGNMLTLFLATIAAVTGYIFVSRFLMLREGLLPKPKGEFVGKGIILIIAVEIFIVGSEIARAYLPKDFAARPWNISDIIELILGLAPIIIACIFYKFAIKFIQEDKAEQTAKEKPATLDV